MMFLGTTDFRLQAVTVVEAGRRDVYPGRRLVLKRTPCLALTCQGSTPGSLLWSLLPLSLSMAQYRQY